MFIVTEYAALSTCKDLKTIQVKNVGVVGKVPHLYKH